MKPARLAVLAIALVAGGGAAFMMSGSEAPPPPSVVETPLAPTTDVLVTTADLQVGQTVKAADLRWQAWPDQAVAAGYVTRAKSPTGLEDTVGSIARSGFLASEPIRPEKLVKAGGGFMAAILPPGMRAVAVEIAKGGSSTAGGFVLPNDRVDVIGIAKNPSSPTGQQIAQTLMSDIRVLAVGQVVQERNGETVVTGETATLGLTPDQAEIVTLAQKVGSISLSLRSIQDAGVGAKTVVEPAPENGLTVVRFGVAQQQQQHAGAQ